MNKRTRAPQGVYAMPSLGAIVAGCHRRRRHRLVSLLRAIHFHFVCVAGCHYLALIAACMLPHPHYHAPPLVRVLIKIHKHTHTHIHANAQKTK